MENRECLSNFVDDFVFGLSLFCHAGNFVGDRSEPDQKRYNTRFLIYRTRFLRRKELNDLKQVRNLGQVGCFFSLPTQFRYPYHLRKVQIIHIRFMGWSHPFASKTIDEETKKIERRRGYFEWVPNI